MGLAEISAVAFPLFLAIGGIAAWRMSRRERSFEVPEKPTWRDDSLDDWRRERDVQLERERLERLEESGERTGQEEQQESQQKTQTRLGG